MNWDRIEANWKQFRGAAKAQWFKLTDDSFGFARGILNQAHVAITPGRDFGRNHPERHIRIAYTQPVARLKEAVERIGKYIESRK